MIDYTGRLVDLKVDYYHKKAYATFEVNEEPRGLEELKDTDLKLKIARKKGVRSLDSNDYFHVLNRKLAQRLKKSEAYMKNELLARYGQKEFLDEMEEHPAILTTQIAPEDFMKKEFLHVSCCDIRVKGETTWYSYYVLRGSHTYNSAEMARLIQGTIEDCKEQGIETATPDELARMQALWENRGKNEQQRKGGKGGT